MLWDKRLTTIPERRSKEAREPVLQRDDDGAGLRDLGVRVRWDDRRRTVLLKDGRTSDRRSWFERVSVVDVGRQIARFVEVNVTVAPV